MARLRTGALIGILFLIGSACRPSRLLLTPVPERILRLEGYAQLTIREGRDQSRSKFSFNFDLPSLGRIEVSNFIGISLYRILFANGKAYLILPSKKAYWEAEEEEIIEKFLGFPVSLTEMLSFFTGQWPTPRSDSQGISAWLLERDQQNRILSGNRADLGFRVEKFINDSSIPQILVFNHILMDGQVKFLNLAFNRPPRPEIFNLNFQSRYQAKTWEEIQEYLNHED